MGHSVGSGAGLFLEDRIQFFSRVEFGFFSRKADLDLVFSERVTVRKRERETVRKRERDSQKKRKRDSQKKRKRARYLLEYPGSLGDPVGVIHHLVLQP